MYGGWEDGNRHHPDKFPGDAHELQQRHQLIVCDFQRSMRL